MNNPYYHRNHNDNEQTMSFIAFALRFAMIIIILAAIVLTTRYFMEAAFAHEQAQLNNSNK